MILNKLQSMSFARLLHVALSLLCFLVLVLGLASGALASSADFPTSGILSDFTYFYSDNIGGFIIKSDDSSSYVTLNNGHLSGFVNLAALGVAFGSSLSSGSITVSSLPASTSSLSLSAYDLSGHSLGSVTFLSDLPFTWAIPSGTVFLGIAFSTQSYPQYTYLYYSTVTFSNLVYSDTTGSQLSSILSGVSAIAQSLLDLETGPYSGVSSVSVDKNGDLQHILTQNASLEDLLNALGIAGTDTNHVIRGIYNNFGSYFTLYSIDDSTSSTTQVYRGLPQYVNALGQSVTDGINRLQRDHDLLYQQTADLSDALYADTLDSPSQSWSVAEWLRGIFTSINDFISSFWSPAETDLKEAAEEGMQEAADRGIAGSADQVGDMDDLGSGFSSFGSTGNIGAGDLLDSLTSGDYSFFSQATQDNLSLHPPVSQSRGLRSVPSDQVEYVDELSKNRAALQEVLGLP